MNDHSFIHQVVMNGTRLSLFDKLQDNGYLNNPVDGKLSSNRCVAAGASVGVFSGFISSALYMVNL